VHTAKSNWQQYIIKHTYKHNVPKLYTVKHGKNHLSSLFLFDMKN